MKKYCKFICLLLIVSLLISNSATITAYACSDTNKYIVSTELSASDMENVSERATPNWAKWALRALWYFARNLSNGVFSQEPIRNITDQRIELTTGSIKYNSGDVGGSSYIDLEVEADNANSVNFDIMLTADTSFLNGLVDTIGVTLTNPDGYYDINQQLGYNGIAIHAINSANDLGTYRATFAENDSTSWNCGAVLYNYNAKSLSEISNNMIVNSEMTRFYLLPSENFTSKKVGFVNKNLTVDSLYNQFYDVNLKEFVYSLKNYDIGDQIIVRDVISEIIYDEYNNRTILSFETSYGTAKWPFDGNLSSVYKVGDILEFDFEVVCEYTKDDIKLESINYFKSAYEKLSNPSIKVQISDYLEMN